MSVMACEAWARISVAGAAWLMLLGACPSSVLLAGTEKLEVCASAQRYDNLAQVQKTGPLAGTNPENPVRSDSDFRDAEAAFPRFCEEWAAKLRRRQVDNVAHIQWHERNGYETGTYVGYTRIESCVCKHSSKGMPVGRISYHEEIYYLVGRTIEEAKHAKPQLVGTTSIIELFNWNHHHWQY
jgi:hypothetical protein